MKTLEGWTLNGPASQDEISRLEAETGISLPEDYAAFLREHDGGQGWIEDRYYVLFSLEEMFRLLGMYAGLGHYAEIVAFGSDGAGEMFCFDRRGSGAGVVLLPTSGTLADAVQVGATLADVLAFDIVAELGDGETGEGAGA